MNKPSDMHCPSSEDFFYWPPEEIALYENWCELSQIKHRKRMDKVTNKKDTSYYHSNKAYLN